MGGDPATSTFASASGQPVTVIETSSWWWCRTRGCEEGDYVPDPERAATAHTALTAHRTGWRSVSTGSAAMSTIDLAAPVSDRPQDRA